MSGPGTFKGTRVGLCMDSSHFYGVVVRLELPIVEPGTTTEMLWVEGEELIIMHYGHVIVKLSDDLSGRLCNGRTARATKGYYLIGEPWDEVAHSKFTGEPDVNGCVELEICNCLNHSHPCYTYTQQFELCANDGTIKEYGVPVARRE